MVSPFMSPGVSAHRLQAVILLTATAVGYEAREQMVAVSLSPCESLLLPLTQFRVLTQMYARRAYPMLQCLEIDRPAAIRGCDRLMDHQIGDINGNSLHKVAAHQTLSDHKAMSNCGAMRDRRIIMGCPHHSRWPWFLDRNRLCAMPSSSLLHPPPGYMYGGARPYTCGR